MSKKAAPEPLRRLELQPLYDVLKQQDWAALNLLELIVAIWPPPECADVLAAYGALRALRARLLLRPRVAECVRRRAVGRWG